MEFLTFHFHVIYMVLMNNFLLMGVVIDPFIPAT